MALYRKVLEAEPANIEIERKLAPLLAQIGQRSQAGASYRRAGEALAQHGDVEQALPLYREAAKQTPRDSAVWKGLAELEAKRGRRTEAVHALWTGARALRARGERMQAVELLERAHELDPASFEVAFELAIRLGRAGQRQRAVQLLEALATERNARWIRRIRARQLRLAPGPRTAWRWLHVAVSEGRASGGGYARSRS